MGLEMGPMSSPVVTSYRLPIVGLSLTVFAMLRLVMDRHTDGRTDGRRDAISLAIGGTMHYSAPAPPQNRFVGSGRQGRTIVRCLKRRTGEQHLAQNAIRHM